MRPEAKRLTDKYHQNKGFGDTVCGKEPAGTASQDPVLDHIMLLSLTLCIAFDARARIRQSKIPRLQAKTLVDVDQAVATLYMSTFHVLWWWLCMQHVQYAKIHPNLGYNCFVV